MGSRRTLSGRYVLDRPIASGGQAAVWAARDLRLGRDVAVKLIPAELASRPGVLDRFRREAVAAAGLVHPNVAQVYDSGRDSDTYYIVMELLEGGSLESLLRTRLLGPRDAAVVGRAVALALDYAHSKGILHRDVKPSNVLFTQTGFPKLADFGIARPLGSPADEVTGTGQLVGTLSYMAPEQLEGAPASQASDLYSLGLVMYRAMAGLNPRATADPSRLSGRDNRSIPPVAERVPDLDPTFAALVDACLETDPDLRPASAREVAEALVPFCEGRTEVVLGFSPQRAGPDLTLVDDPLQQPRRPAAAGVSPSAYTEQAALPEKPPLHQPPPDGAELHPTYPQAWKSVRLRTGLRIGIGLAACSIAGLAGHLLASRLFEALVEVLPAGLLRLGP